MCDHMNYRFITPDGKLWTESHSLEEIMREATKWDWSKGDLRILKQSVQTNRGPWQDVV